MRKGFTLVETLAALTLLLLAVMFGARVTFFALHQARRAGVRFRMMEMGDHYKHYLCSQPFSAPELVDGVHVKAGRELSLSWRVGAAAAGLKQINLRIIARHHSLALDFFKSKFIQEVKE